MDNRRIPISIVNLYNLWKAVIEASSDQNIGYLDADRTEPQLLVELNRVASAPLSAVESALASANMLNEIGKFSHTNGITFDEFVTQIGRGKKFDKEYNVYD